MILFLELLFGTWYKGGLCLLILCIQLVHMYDVELGSIWIWKYRKLSWQLIWKYLSCF
jgi:hypothetical protein